MSATRRRLAVLASLVLSLAIGAGALFGGAVAGGTGAPGPSQVTRDSYDGSGPPCREVRARRVSARTHSPDGQKLSSPSTDWIQFSASCSPAAKNAFMRVGDCPPGCGGGGHRQIVEYWAHSPTCSLLQSPWPNAEIQCVIKADGRICFYLRTSPPPDASTAMTQVQFHIEMQDNSAQDGFAPLGPPGDGCGPGDHPINTAPPAVTGGSRRAASAASLRAKPGDSLTCNPGQWTGDQPLTYVYQWLRDGVALAKLSNTGNTYTIQAGDVGHQLACAVRATNPEKDRKIVRSAPVTVTAPDTGTPPPTGGPPPPVGRFTVAPKPLAQADGSIILVFALPAAGKLDVGQDTRSTALAAAAAKLLVKAVHKQVAAAGKVKIRIRPTAAGKAKLRKTGKLRVKLRAVYTPTGGAAQTRKLTVTLKLKKRPS